MPARTSSLASNRGPLSFTARRRRCAARGPRRWRAWWPGSPAAPRARGCAPRSPTATAGRSSSRAGGRLVHPDGGERAGPHARDRPGHVHPRVRLGRQLDAVVPAPPAVRHRATAGVRPALRAATGRRTCDYNAAFAAAVAEEAAPSARVLVQDYHLSARAAAAARRCGRTCASGTSRTRRGRRRTYFRMLPDELAAELLLGLLGADRAGVPQPAVGGGVRRSCCAAVLGAQVDGLDGDGPLLGAARRPHHGRRRARARRRRRRAAGARRQPDVLGRLAVLREQVGERQALVRVDRTELSKNIVRGLEAYRELLHRYPHWRGEVVHLAFAYPSRHDLPVYREYTGQVQRLAQEINDEFGRPGWEPVAAARAGRLPALARGVPARRRAAGEPGPRRDEPGRQGGAGAVRQRAARWCSPARRARPTSWRTTRCW